MKTVHEGVKFDCKLCDYKANRKSNLSQHVKSIHEGIKYDCKLCDYKAKQRNSLTKHVESIHEGFKFECQLWLQTTKPNLKAPTIPHVQSIQERITKRECK